MTMDFILEMKKEAERGVMISWVHTQVTAELGPQNQ